MKEELPKPQIKNLSFVLKNNIQLINICYNQLQESSGENGEEGESEN